MSETSLTHTRLGCGRGGALQLLCFVGMQGHNEEQIAGSWLTQNSNDPTHSPILVRGSAWQGLKGPTMTEKREKMRGAI